MKRLIQFAIVTSLAFVLWQVSADARFLDLQKKEQVPALNTDLAPTPLFVSPNPIYKSEVKPQGIHLQFEDLTLLDVVRNIQEETGILFSIDPSIESAPFSSSIQAENWEDVVKKLLKGFSRVEVWSSNLETSRVWVLAGNRESATQKPDIRLNHSGVSGKSQVRVASTPRQTSLSSIRIEDLPPHILFEPGVLTFFKLKGVRLPENVKNMFGPNLEGLPANMPISPHILNDPKFINFLNSQGIKPPRA